MGALVTPPELLLPKVPTASLLEAFLLLAQRQNRLAEAQLAPVRGQLAALYRRLGRRKLLGHSASMPLEEAGELMQHLLYTLGIALRTAGTERSLVLLCAGRQNAAETLYDIGHAQLAEDLRRLRSQWRAAISTRTPTTSPYYNHTVGRGIAAFFAGYDIHFAAHETPGDLDYPLCVAPAEDSGLVYMQSYLHNLLCENRLCARFSPAAIARAHSREHPHYTQLFLNLWQPVLLAALGCALSGRPVQALEPDAAVLNQLFGGRPDVVHCRQLLHQGADVLCAQLPVQDSTLQHYVRQGALQAAPALHHAVFQGHVPTFFAGSLAFASPAT